MNPCTECHGTGVTRNASGYCDACRLCVMRAEAEWQTATRPQKPRPKLRLVAEAA